MYVRRGAVGGIALFIRIGERSESMVVKG
jgi:hypothetical protein